MYNFDVYGVQAAGLYRRTWKHYSGGQSVAVFPDAAICVDIVGLRAFTLDTGSVHGSNAAQLIVRVAPAAQT